jgi:predicted HicB family RNase H-like nuclease
MVGFQLRFQERLRAQLEAAAKEHGTSLNSEVIARLEDTVRRDQDAGGVRSNHLLNLVAVEIGRAEAATGRHWWSDLATHSAAVKLAADALARAAPLPANYAEYAGLMAEWSARQADLKQFETILRACNVLNPLHELLSRYSDSTVPQVRPQEEWTMAGGAPITNEDVRRQLAEFLDVYRQLLRECSELDEQTKPVREARQQAARDGEAIYRSLTAHAQQELGDGA